MDANLIVHLAKKEQILLLRILILTCELGYILLASSNHLVELTVLFGRALPVSRGCSHLARSLLLCPSTSCTDLLILQPLHLSVQRLALLRRGSPDHSLVGLRASLLIVRHGIVSILDDSLIIRNFVVGVGPACATLLQNILVDRV